VCSSDLSKKQKNPRPRAILVGFPNQPDREKIWAAKPKLKDTKVFVSPDLPKEIEARRQKMVPTYRKAKSMPKYQKSTYLNDDRLTINKKVYTVDNMADLPDDLDLALDATQSRDGVTIFFTKHSPLSNHFTEAPFNIGGNVYTSTEQHYFACKAREMGDEGKLGEIMGEHDPPKIKYLGHQCTNKNNIKWETMCYKFMKFGCTAKFEQNDVPREALLATGTDKLGEASASDEFWGLGMSLYHADRWNTNLWKGNAMGQILTEIRDGYM
jgi:hypothetical protein